MILPNPSDAALKSADAITLFDPKVASWHQVVVYAPSRPNSGSRFTVLDIPVDSTDAAAVRTWHDRIKAARATP